MALKFVIKKSNYYKFNGIGYVKASDSITLNTESLTATRLYMNMDSKCHEYKISLLDVSFHKKMYQPTKVVASLKIMSTDNTWSPISKTEMDDIFKGKEVALYDDTGVTQKNGKDDIPEANKVGLDFYVQEIQTCYKKDSMVVTLKIYSPDKKLTLEKNSCTFVSKQMSDVLSSVLTAKNITYGSDKMKVLSYMGKDSSSNNVIREHIFPYLVQYNESFYDMLARTCNRWGEFLFYENGQLNVGYSFNDTSSSDTESSEATVITNSDASKNKFNNYTYIDLSKHTFGENYHRSANYDSNIIDNPYQKSPNKVEGILFSPGEKWDIMLVNKFTSFLKNDKNLPTWIGNELFDDLFALASKSATAALNNSEFDDDHFADKDKKQMPTQYGEYEFKVGKDKKEKKEGFNPFSEISSKFVDTLYKTILSNEQKAGEGAVSIDFDTTFPGLKLGQVVKVNSEYFIVVQIDCKPIDKDGKPAYVYQVIATPQSDKKVKICIKDNDDKDNSNPPKPKLKEKEVKIFYPTVLPTGHVRFADPQMATVIKADDPLGNGRVRVRFTWQDSKEEASPWLQYAANASGQKGIIGKHYEKDNVFVGYVDGNVERPYVIGAISKGAGSDIQCVTPGGHVLKINDDPAGFSKFFTGMFLPGWKTVSAFVPQMSKFPEGDDAIKMGGGFELSDNYGFYKISGSSDARNITVASPWGDVSISAFTGITISAPNGDVKISGKNVTIEAGNNLNLVSGKNVDKENWFVNWKKDSKGGTAAQFGQDIAVAVTKKLAQKLTNIVDLSIIRAVAEIIFKPVEGSLTVKSNRFLKLEAGKDKCKYPEIAYNLEKKQALLDAENKSTILSAVGSSTNFLGKLSNISLDNGMVTLITAVRPAAEALVSDFINQYKVCVLNKRLFVSAVNSLALLSNDDGAVCKTFAELKADFWAEGEYQEWGEDKLAFKDNVGILKDADLDDETKLHQVVSNDKAKASLGAAVDPSAGMMPSQFKSAAKTIIKNRSDQRARVLGEAKKLRKSICDLLKIAGVEKERKDMHQYFSSIYFQNLPKGFKDELLKAMSKSSCKDSPFYTISDDWKNLDNSQNLDLDSLLKKHTRRLVAYKLLTNLGFKEDTRIYVSGSQVPEPTCADLDPNGAKSLVNDVYWGNYVESLSGVPPLQKEDKTFGGALRAAATSSLEDFKKNFYALKNTINEISSWGDGKKGQILMANGGKTYYMNDQTFTEVQGIKSTITYLSEDTQGLDEHQTSKLRSFVNAMKDALKKDQF